MDVLLPPPRVVLHQGFFPPAESERFFAALRRGLAWRQDEMRLGARAIKLPRLTAWHGDPEAIYTYSGIENHPAPWTQELEEIKRRAEEAAGERFNSVLANLYRSGVDSMGWHSDDERNLFPTIASVTLGATRTFQLRRKAQPRDLVSMRLSNGSLLVMLDDTQLRWQHRVPKEQAAGERINLTFRRVKV